MDVYRQAVEIIGIVHAGNGTAKALCLRKEIQKKRQTYAVVCETLRHYELLEDVLAASRFFESYPRANRGLALCMAYDTILGKGVSTGNDSTARAVRGFAPYLRKAYWRVHKHHFIPPRIDVMPDSSNVGAPATDTIRVKGQKIPRDCRKASESGEDQSVSPPWSVACIPRYARINTLKVGSETLIRRLRRAEGCGADGNRATAGRHTCEDGLGGVAGGDGVACGSDTPRRDRRLTPFAFTEDSIVPSLLVFPPGTDLHAHPAVRSGQLVLQDRASCLPACILLDCVPVEKPFKASAKKSALAGIHGDENDENTDVCDAPLEYVIDACAAPGNKTSQLAALAAPHIKIMAVERDKRRAELLQHRILTLGAADYVNVVNEDFFHILPADRNAAEGILLDPSCSASGVITRVDVSLMHHRYQHSQCGKAKGKGLEPEGSDVSPDRPHSGPGTIDPKEQSNIFSSNTERVRRLAWLQRKLLSHSLLSFNNCRTVVYSTCSVHEEENECVVRQVLENSRVQERGWRLSNIMPGVWHTRGIRRSDDDFPMDHAIRCDPVADMTNGFFVARFDRQL